jgi:hypothetical protein
MSMIQTVLLALKDKAPALHRQLAEKGELRAYAADLADQISSQAVDLTQQQRLREKWGKLGPMECAAKMKMAHELNLEVVMADLLEFPQDETSPSRPD